MELKAISQQILLVQRDLKVHIQWIRSAFTADRMVCLFVADDEADIREHARRSGLPIQRISEVSAITGPALDSADRTADRIEELDSALFVSLAGSEETLNSPNVADSQGT